MNYYLKCFISKYSGKTKIAKYVILLVVIPLILTNCSTHRINRLKHKSYKKWKSYQWTETKRSSDKDLAEWIIYSRKIKGTNLLEYKIEGEIESTSEDCFIAFKQEIYNEANKIDNQKYPTYKIINESKESLLTYVIHNEPFPFKDTEMSVKYTFNKNESGDTEIYWHEAWTETSVQPTKKLKRVETFRGSWQFLKVDENKVKAINIVQFDPKGMPNFLVRPMVTKFLKNGLEKLRVQNNTFYY